MITVDGLVKRYGTKAALDGVSVSVRRGTIHGVLGPNGAGKTTLLEVLLGHRRADSGTVRFDDAQVGARLVAYQPETPAIYEYLTVGEFLDLAARLAPDGNGGEAEARKQRLLEMFEMEKQAGALCHTLSAGMRRKTSIMAAMIQAAPILILDEPTNHLDTTASVRLKRELRRLGAEGSTVILSTHLLDFAVGLCDDVTLLSESRVVFAGSVQDVPGTGSVEERIVEVLGLEYRET
jgi:ABC-2 type transport system ATP-binding protein